MIVCWLKRTYLPLQKSSGFVICIIYYINYTLFKITGRTVFIEPDTGPWDSVVLRILTFEKTAENFEIRFLHICVFIVRFNIKICHKSDPNRTNVSNDLKQMVVFCSPKVNSNSA